MKHRSLIYLALCLVVLSGIVYHILPEEAVVSQHSFSLGKSDAVNKILLYKKNLPSGGFTKDRQGAWHLNSTLKVDSQMADLLIKTLEHLKVKSTVPTGLQKSVVAKLKKEGFVIEYYHNDFLTKAFFIGACPANPSYSYVLLEGDHTPYVVHVEGGNRSLQSLLSLPEIDWRDRTLFATAVEDIMDLKVEYFLHKEDSFEITQQGGKLKLGDGDTSNTKGLINYLKNFKNLKAGALASGNPILLDSLKSSKAFCKISLKDSKKEHNEEISLYHSKANPDLIYAVAKHNTIFILSSENIQHILTTRKALLKA